MIRPRRIPGNPPKAMPLDQPEPVEAQKASAAENVSRDVQMEDLASALLDSLAFIPKAVRKKGAEKA